MVEAVASKGAGERVTRVAAVLTVSAAPAVPQPPRGPAGADVASLSGTVTRLAGKPPVDLDRVAQIKHAVANGTFPILPAKIADAMLALRYDWMAK